MEKTRHLNSVPVGHSAAGPEQFFLGSPNGPIAIREASDEQLAEAIKATMQQQAQLDEQFRQIIQGLAMNGANFSVISYEIDRRTRVLTIASHLQN